MDLNLVWFVLIGVLIGVYAVLDGFDLGVGVLHLFAKSDREKRIHMNAIGPVWDGNEVWLITGGGALFAAFPVVYATVLSGFYLAIYLVLLALILRAVSLEFRGKVESERWQSLWDIFFGTGSLAAALLFGVAVGNILKGVPINAHGIYEGTFLQLLNPFALLTGILTVVLLSMHGAVYLALKSEDELQERMIGYGYRLWAGTGALYIVVTLFTLVSAPELMRNAIGNPLFWAFFVFLVGSLSVIPVWLKCILLVRTFIASSLAVFSLVGIAATSIFPKLVPSSIDPDFSLTIYNSASSPKTLMVMFIIAMVGMPLVIGYTIFIYRQFKGKVVITESSY